MPGDYTRWTFDPLDDFELVLQQQGRPTVDADHNELAERLDRRMRVTTRDTVGRAVVPTSTIDGFSIRPVAGDLEIGAGRAYVDGIPVDNHGAPPLGFDGELEENRSVLPWTWTTQPYPPGGALPQGGLYAVGLDVWRREVTWAEDPLLLDPALYGVDTAARRQTVWQVRLVEIGRDGAVSCENVADDPAWADATFPSAARLTTAAVGVPAVDDPCEVSLSGGYRGVENRLYRVEVHTPGLLGAATFCWSRDNAALAAPVIEMTAPDQVRVARTGRDDVFRFTVGDWVEILDDPSELAGVPGVLVNVQAVDPVESTITLSANLPAGRFDPADPMTRTRVRRWDQRADGAGAPLANGEVAISAAPFELEDGVQVTFSLADPGRPFRTGEYWMFVARTADSSVELLDRAPPRGPHHHWASLAVWDVNTGVADDCRTIWPPAEGAGGCCAVEVNPESWIVVLRRIIDDTSAQDVSICFGAGQYELPTDVAIEFRDKRAVRIQGQGRATVIRSANRERVLSFDGCGHVEVGGLAVLVSGEASGRQAGLVGAVNGLVDIRRARTARVYDLVARTLAAPRPAMACVAVAGLYNDEAPGADVVVQGCTLVPGAQQVGILALDTERVVVRDNVIGRFAGIRTKQGDLDRMLEDPEYRRRMAKLLFRSPRRIFGDGKLEEGEHAVRVGDAGVAFRSVGNLGAEVAQFIEAQAARRRDGRPQSTRQVISFAAGLLGDPYRKEPPSPAMRDLRRLVLANRPPAAAAGVVVAGRRADSVRVEGNDISDTRLGVRVALSDRGASFTAGRVVVADNLIWLLVTLEGIGLPHRGVHLGHARSVDVTGNEIRVDRKGFTRQLGMSTEGVRIWGRMGRRRAVVGNTFSGQTTGIRFTNLNHPPGTVMNLHNDFEAVTTEVES